MTWLLVELASDVVELSLPVRGQIKAFGEVLSQQAVGVFMGAALPESLRIAELDVDVRLHAKQELEGDRDLQTFVQVQVPLIWQIFNWLGASTMPRPVE